MAVSSIGLRASFASTSVSHPSSSSSSSRKDLKLSPWEFPNGGSKIRLCSNQGWICREKRKPSKDFFQVLSVFSAASEEKLTSNTRDSYDAKADALRLASEDSSSGSSCIFNERTHGKPGFVYFYGFPYRRRYDIIKPTEREAAKILWFLGPSVLVSFLVLPSLYLRQILSAIFEDSLLTDFLILFFTEAIFYIGVCIFVAMADHAHKPVKQTPFETYKLSQPFLFGLRVSSVVALVLCLIIPLVTMGMVWPWTGPAASAALAPYLVGHVVQFGFEQYASYRKSPSWSVIPIIFQVYRLHQLNRAAQLVTALTFSVRAAEATPQTVAVTGSLGTLLVVLQVLGIICVWSMASFLMRFLLPAASQELSSSSKP